jgi:hypothetical protein
MSIHPLIRPKLEFLRSNRSPWAVITVTWLFLAANLGLAAWDHFGPYASQTAKQGSFAETYGFTASDARKVRDEFFKIQNSLPPLLILQTAYEFEARTVADGLFGGITRAGVSVTPPVVTKALNPQETGISIRVADSSKIPAGARAVGDALQKALGAEPKYTAMRELQDDQFTIFVGSNPNEH